jgi:FKBP12-rapamycin complex-associated protein
MYELYAMTAQPVSKISPARRLTPLDDEFYPTVALQALTSILKDPSLAVYHQIAMQAIMFIFDSLGLRCVPFLKGIVPHMLYTARTCGQATLREALMKQIARLSSIVKDNLQPYVPAIFEVIEEFWDSQHLATILRLIEQIASGVPNAFRQYVSLIIQNFLSTLNEFQSGSWSKTSQTSNEVFDRLRLVLESMRNLRENMVEYIHILVPALLKLVDSLINPSLHFGICNDLFHPLAIHSIGTVSMLLQTKTTSALKGQGAQMPALAAQPLIRMIGSESDARKEVGIAMIETLCVCARKIGKVRWLPLYHLAARNSVLQWHRKFNVVDPQALDDSSLQNSQIGPQCVGMKEYDDLIQGFISLQIFDDDGHKDKDEEIKQAIGVESSSHPLMHDLNPVPQNKSQTVSQLNLSRSWDVSQKQTREDWDEWMRHFAIQLLREAPATSLRATAELAYAYQPLARELFSAAFACCWSKLSDEYRASLIEALKTVFFADISPEILQTLLNLAEYAERDGIPGGLPIQIDILAELALKCRSYAKALHYKEREHEEGGGGHCIEDLITINRKLDLPGKLKVSQRIL